MPDRCSSCQAPIIWSVTETGRKCPIDADPVPDGNLILVKQLIGPPLMKVFNEKTHPNWPRRYVSHFATCAHAAEHRRRNA